MTEAEERIPCPHCAELILPAAKVCRFCGRDIVLSAIAATMGKPGEDTHMNTNVNTPEPTKEIQVAALAKLFFLVLLVLCVGWYFISTLFVSDADMAAANAPLPVSVATGRATLDVTSREVLRDCSVRINNAYEVRHKTLSPGNHTFIPLAEFTDNSGNYFPWASRKVLSAAVTCGAKSEVFSVH